MMQNERGSHLVESVTNIFKALCTMSGYNFNHNSCKQFYDHVKADSSSSKKLKELQNIHGLILANKFGLSCFSVYFLP